MLGRRGRLLGAVALVAAALMPAVLSPAPAHAATTYAYWSYWHDKSGSGTSFTYSGCGPYYPQGDCVPADGTVEGWRFTVSSESGAPPPRFGGSFAQICSSKPAQDGMKRVAFVVDYGTQPDSPNKIDTACAVGKPDDNGGTLLSSVFTVTTGKDAFVCAINGYPKSGCGQYVPASSPTPKATTTTKPGTTAKPTAPAGTTSSVAPLATGGASPTPVTTASTGATSATVSPAPGAVVTDPTATTAPTVEQAAPKKKASSGSPVGTIIGIVVIVSLAGVGIATSKSRRRTP